MFATPLRLDARLFAPPPAPRPHQMGRPPQVGKRLPKLSTVLQDPNSVWERLTVDWYGGTKRTLEVTTGTALWYSTGTEPLPIGWVLTRDPEGKREPKAYFSTDQGQCAMEIVEDARQALESGSDLRREPGTPGDRNPAPMVGFGD